MRPTSVYRCMPGGRAALCAGFLFATLLSAQSQFQGSVATGTASPTPLELKLDDAIHRGLQTNLGLLVRDTNSMAVRAERKRALAALLPQVTGSLAETEQQLSRSTIGFNFKFPAIPGFSGIPTVFGPFHYTAAQANVSAKVFDWNAWKTLSSARASEEAARLSVQDARDLVVQAVASGYLQIIADASRVLSIQAQVNTADAIYNRAVDQKKAGTSPGIDVLRAQVELKMEQQRMLAQQNLLEKDKLALARVIGLPAGQVFEIADAVPFAPLAGLTQEDALRMALAQRPDYQSARMLVEGAQESLKAARAEWYPTVNVDGYYGDAGQSLNNSHGVFLVTGALNFNIFNGGRIRSDIERASAALKQRSDEMADLAGQIDYQVRAAFLDVRTAADQVAVAQSNLELADQTLAQSRDRFAAGVTDTVEVVQSQESVAAANDNIISALFAHNLAKVELARAMGLAEQGIKKYIEVK